MSISMFRFAIVVSEFNEEITEKLLAGAVSHFQSRGISMQQLTIIKVPGAVEIPLTAKLLAQSQKYHAIVCLGAVIRGDTSHYDYVCQQVSYGCQKVMLELNLPVIFGILTTENLEQAYARVGGAEGHKGVDAAETAIRMAQIVKALLPEAANLDNFYISEHVL